MNSENNLQNESADAPEDDEFGEFEGPEDEAPEAVQAMVGGPNWIFPDLVRVQSSNNSVNNQSGNPDESPPDSARRVLDPPDVSLSSISSNQPNTLDLCNQLHSTKLYNFNNSKGSSNPSNVSANVSSPSSSGSSSSSSSGATNLSGLALSNTSNSSTVSPSHTVLKSADLTQPSTSRSCFEDPIDPSTLATNQRLVLLQREIRTLEMEKSTLQRQLSQRDAQLKSAKGSKQPAEGLQQLSHTIERMQVNVENSLNSLENRIDQLECRLGPKMANGLLEEVNFPITDSEDLVQRFMQEMKQQRDAEREDLLNLFTTILTSALASLDAYRKRRDCPKCPSNLNGKSDHVSD